ncbi:MAG: hypothetical protein JSW26_25200 [Desulfobacterales bacterium]|nr:MAG: hypothetical protein JSW26_25200 [Desulfobacterales bacterium]
MHSLLKKLRGGDRRSIGRVEEVVEDVLEDASLFEPLLGGLFVDDPVVRMRAADAVEKITADRWELLQPHKSRLIRVAGQTDQQEVRWHVAQILPRLQLDPEEKKRAVNILYAYLDDRSKIVVTFALQALADFAVGDKKLRPDVVRLLREFIKTGSPAIKSRGKKLLERLKPQLS